MRAAYWPGQKSRGNAIPIPAGVQREWLEKANLRLPEALPAGNVTSGARKHPQERIE